MATNDTQVMTGAMAIIKTKTGRPIGIMDSLSWTENVRTEDIKGLGDFYPVSIESMSWSGSGRCSFMMINLKSTGLQESINRDVANSTEFANTLIFKRESFDLYVYKKVPKEYLENNVVAEITELPFAVIEGILIESDAVDMSTDRVTKRNQSFKFSRPVLYRK